MFESKYNQTLDVINTSTADKSRGWSFQSILSSKPCYIIEVYV